MERLNVEWTVKGYRVYNPGNPEQTVAYYDEDEFDTIKSDIVEHGYSIGKMEREEV